MRPDNFYLGVHRPHWLWDEDFRDIPLFVSHRTLKERKGRLPRAVTRWALDSGGYTELNTTGKWETTPEEYVSAVHRYMAELGGLDWASPQDWMCEPWVIAKSGLSVLEHQWRTVENFLHLRDLAPDIPWAPVLQGWEMSDYVRIVGMYEAAGVDLMGAPVVGVGSVCRRQSTEQIGEVFAMLRGMGLTNLHGFGVKRAGLARYGHLVATSDSMAWSYRARRAAPDRRALGLTGSVPGCPKTHCGNCKHFALDWRDRVMSTLLSSQGGVA